MTLAELLAIAGGAPLELDASAVAIIEDSRAVVEEVLASGDRVYGLNTGLGSNKDTRPSYEDQAEFQQAMIRGHAGAVGPPLPVKAVRAAMAVRVNGMARGGSGASPACARTLVSMLNRGVHPVVPSSGSVGASDLAQMAAIALVATGEGQAELAGQTMPGGEALRRAGIEPLRLGYKDGLAMMSANGISIGEGALAIARAMRMLEVADLAAALSLEAMSGNSSPFDPAVAAAKGVKGQVRVSDHIRGLLRGSRVLEPDPARSVQDPLSFRVVPQVHGALWDYIDLARRTLETELNAMTDNPLVSRQLRKMLSNGNFHPMTLALSFDALRPALAHAGQLSDRRMSHLWAATSAHRDVWFYAGSQHGASLRYAGAAACAELRELADAATLDIAPLDRAVEDHATGAPLSVRRTDDALNRMIVIFAVEVLMARDLLAPDGVRTAVGAGTATLMDLVDSTVKAAEGRPAAELHAALCEAMEGRLLEDVARSAAPLSWE